MFDVVSTRQKDILKLNYFGEQLDSNHFSDLYIIIRNEVSEVKDDRR